MERTSPEARTSSELGRFPKRAKLDEIELPNGKKFDKILLECVDESLADLLSPKVRDAAYSVMERTYSIPRNDIPRKPNQFGTCLEQVFGVAGKTIGRTIARRLYSKLGLDFFDRPGYEFHDYIRAAKPKVSIV